MGAKFYLFRLYGIIYIGKNVVYVVENATNDTIKQIPSEARVDSMIRLQRLMGLHVDENG